MASAMPTSSADMTSRLVVSVSTHNRSQCFNRVSHCVHWISSVMMSYSKGVAMGAGGGGAMVSLGSFGVVSSFSHALKSYSRLSAINCSRSSSACNSSLNRTGSSTSVLMVTSFLDRGNCARLARKYSPILPAIASLSATNWSSV